jgi:hypothetical protein
MLKLKPEEEQANNEQQMRFSAPQTRELAAKSKFAHRSDLGKQFESNRS